MDTRAYGTFWKWVRKFGAAGSCSRACSTRFIPSDFGASFEASSLGMRDSLCPAKTQPELRFFLGVLVRDY